MNSKNCIKSEKLLLVEGKDEVSFFEALLKHLQIENVEIIDAGGCLKFASAYPTVTNISGFSDVKKIGFVRDAEANPATSAFESLINIIKKYTPTIELPKTSGQISVSDISCGIFIMPNNKDSGMLEDLCINSVKNSSLYQNTENYIKNAENLLSDEEKKVYNIHKAKVQAYLAGKSCIPRNLGEASLKHIWDFENSTFDDIKKFLTKLFES